ncbi:MAG: glycosyltransferase family 4 protein [Nitrososphaerota archaeon]|nr:glycosyltransferase family 4 protein [Nitrososphaerota archaeon]
MRICYVAADVAVPHYRGSSTHVFELARNLAKRGHEVHVVARRVFSSQPKEEVLDGFHIHRFQRGILFSSSKSSFAKTESKGSYRGSTPLLIWKSYEAYLMTIFPAYIGAQIARLVKENSIDIIFERESSFGGGAVASMLTGRPLVLEVIGNRVTGLQMRQTKRIIAYTRGLFDGRVEPSKVELVTGAVDVDVFKPDLASRESVRKEYGLVGCPVIGYAGTFQEWHGLDELIQASRGLIQSVPNVKFLMVGPYYKDTEAEVIKEGERGSFIFTGPVPYEAVPSFLNASDVLVAPYNPSKIMASEQARKHGLGSPLKVFEYMATGKPVVTTDVKPISDPIQDGVTGVLVPVGDSKALEEAILMLLSEKEKAGAMGAAARRSVALEYSWERVARKLEGVFESVLTAPRVQAI